MGHPAEHRDNRGAAEFAEKKNPRPTLKKRGWGTRQTRRVGHPAESGRLTRSSLTAQSSQRRRTQDPPSKNEDGAPGRKRKAKQPDLVGVNADAEGAEKMNPRAQSGMTVPQEEPKTHPQKTRMGHPAEKRKRDSSHKRGAMEKRTSPRRSVRAQKSRFADSVRNDGEKTTH